MSQLNSGASDSPQPKVFISYSWSSPAHQELVKDWAERLLADGVDVVLDIFDLKKGHDKYVFMEKMVADATVTHVLVMCDKVYAEKADARQAGVGTESQIISREVYEKVEQSKFIPIACEVDENGEWYLPTFLKTRIGMDFSSPERVNENWEQLIRLLHGQPQHVKPALGKPPAYLSGDTAPASPAIAKFASFRQALLNGKPAIKIYRKEFLDACIAYADALRIRQVPKDDNFGERVVIDCGKLKLVRDHILDWVLLESSIQPNDSFVESLLEFLEQLLEIKARPAGLNPWNEIWFEAHKVFVYETFLYVIAALLKNGAFSSINILLTNRYLQPAGSEHFSEGRPVGFECFWGASEALRVLAPPGRDLYFPAAEMIKRQADRTDLPFSSVMESELVVLLMAFLSPSIRHWYPGTLLYAGQRPMKFFVRATQRKGFQKLSIITGISDVNELRVRIDQGMKRLHTETWTNFWLSGMNFEPLMNLAELDSVK